jgi:hypothetical protein
MDPMLNKDLRSRMPHCRKNHESEIYLPSPQQNNNAKYEQNRSNAISAHKNPNHCEEN